jgi:hypothetical protein
MKKLYILKENPENRDDYFRDWDIYSEMLVCATSVQQARIYAYKQSGNEIWLDKTKVICKVINMEKQRLGVILFNFRNG